MCFSFTPAELRVASSLGKCAAHLKPPDSPPHPKSLLHPSPSLSPTELEHAGGIRGRGGELAGAELTWPIN
jgi:hypothetical protein